MNVGSGAKRWEILGGFTGRYDGVKTSLTIVAFTFLQFGKFQKVEISLEVI